MAVQWKKCSAPPSAVTVPKPAGPSNSVTIPVTSVDDLGQRELDDVGGAAVLELGDQRVDVPLRHHGLHREAAVAVEGVDGRRLHRREDVDDRLEVVRSHVELDQDLAA